MASIKATRRWIEKPSRMHRALADLKPLSTTEKIVRTPLVLGYHILTIPVVMFYMAYVMFGAWMLSKTAKSSGKIVQKQTSRTARTVARLRHILHSAGLGSDRLAALFLTPVERITATFMGLRTKIDGCLTNLGMFPYGFIAARTEMGDELVRRFVEEDGGRQIVCLGAGFDTRAYRIPCVSEPIHDPPVKFFEVDIAPTQETKVQTLTENGIKVDHVTYVPVDFSSEKFTEALERNGWKQDQPTLFLWEGVTYYLQEEAVLETFTAFSKCAKGSYFLADISTDFFTEEGKKNIHEHPGLDRALKYLEKIGEPLQWGLLDNSSRGVSIFLENFGMELVEHLSPYDAEAFFFKKADGQYTFMGGGQSAIVIGRVP